MKPGSVGAFDEGVLHSAGGGLLAGRGGLGAWLPGGVVCPCPWNPLRLHYIPPVRGENLGPGAHPLEKPPLGSAAEKGHSIGGSAISTMGAVAASAAKEG